jgi:uncharacterized protein (TIGR02145 family)
MKKSFLKWLSCLCKGTTWGYVIMRRVLMVVLVFLILTAIDILSSNLHWVVKDSENMPSYECGTPIYEENALDSSDFAQQNVCFADSRDGKKYRAVKIGDQIWMAENLNYAAEGSKCYNNDQANCNRYGRLYDWATAMALPDCGLSTSCGDQITYPHRGICPQGWHIPSNDDWDKLMLYVDKLISQAHNVTGSSLYYSLTAGGYLKATSGWDSSIRKKDGNGQDTYGFSALPGGTGASGGGFYFDGIYGGWWGVSEYGSNACIRSMHNSSDIVVWHCSDKEDYLTSVRCLKD